nr:uncharacterized protein LOC127318691 [Lolium perenne]
MAAPCIARPRQQQALLEQRQRPAGSVANTSGCCALRPSGFAAAISGFRHDQHHVGTSRAAAPSPSRLRVNSVAAASSGCRALKAGPAASPAPPNLIAAGSRVVSKSGFRPTTATSGSGFRSRILSSTPAPRPHQLRPPAAPQRSSPSNSSTAPTPPRRVRPLLRRATPSRAPPPAAQRPSRLRSCRQQRRAHRRLAPWTAHRCVIRLRHAIAAHASPWPAPAPPGSRVGSTTSGSAAPSAPSGCAPPQPPPAAPRSPGRLRLQL